MSIHVPGRYKATEGANQITINLLRVVHAAHYVKDRGAVTITWREVSRRTSLALRKGVSLPQKRMAWVSNNVRVWCTALMFAAMVHHCSKCMYRLANAAAIPDGLQGPDTGVQAVRIHREATLPIYYQRLPVKWVCAWQGYYLVLYIFHAAHTGKDASENTLALRSAAAHQGLVASSQGPLW